MKRDGREAFDAFFSGIYGARWPELRAALGREPRKHVLRNPFGRLDYTLDEASFRAAAALGARPGDHVADLCASPGGKSLTSIFATEGQGQYVVNDLSPARVKRLKAVLHDCLPPEVMTKVRVLTGDASRFGLGFPETFDKVLVDAPCSGERHLLATPKELERWSEKGSKRLAVRQHALLCAGLDSSKPGGRVVYSTCTLSPHENEGVLEKLTKSRRDQFALGETKHILPDTDGCGPIFYAVLNKN